MPPALTVLPATTTYTIPLPVEPHNSTGLPRPPAFYTCGCRVEHTAPFRCRLYVLFSFFFYTFSGGLDLLIRSGCRLDAACHRGFSAISAAWSGVGRWVRACLAPYCSRHHHCRYYLVSLPDGCLPLATRRSRHFTCRFTAASGWFAPHRFRFDCDFRSGWCLPIPPPPRLLYGFAAGRLPATRFSATSTRVAADHRLPRSAPFLPEFSEHSLPAVPLPLPFCLPACCRAAMPAYLRVLDVSAPAPGTRYYLCLGILVEDANCIADLPLPLLLCLGFADSAWFIR